MWRLPVAVVNCCCRRSCVGVGCRLSCDDCRWRLLIGGGDCRVKAISNNCWLLVADWRVKAVGDGCWFCWCWLSFVGISCRLSCEGCRWRLLIVLVSTVVRLWMLIVVCGLSSIGSVIYFRWKFWLSMPSCTSCWTFISSYSLKNAKQYRCDHGNLVNRVTIRQSGQLAETSVR
jgi:hypothetical protein